MQSRLIYFIAGLFAVTIIAVAMLQQSPQMSEDEIKALVNQAVEERIAAIEPQSVAPSSPASSIETSELGPVIEDYLMANPSLLQRMSVALQEETNREQAAQAKLALASLKGPIYDDPDHVVLGNPEGDVTIVEFFDYNCGFCRQALADVMQIARRRYKCPSDPEGIPNFEPRFGRCGTHRCPCRSGSKCVLHGFSHPLVRHTWSSGQSSRPRRRSVSWA